MNFSLIYLIERLRNRIWTFVYNWYIGGLRIIGHRYMVVLGLLERVWALKITVRNLFKPLYQDRTVLGYILGFIFRFFRAGFGAVLYGVVLTIFVLAYGIWAGVLIYIIYWGFFKGA